MSGALISASLTRQYGLRVKIHGIRVVDSQKCAGDYTLICKHGTEEDGTVEFGLCHMGNNALINHLLKEDLNFKLAILVNSCCKVHDLAGVDETPRVVPKRRRVDDEEAEALFDMDKLSSTSKAEPEMFQGYRDSPMRSCEETMFQDYRDSRMDECDGVEEYKR